MAQGVHSKPRYSPCRLRPPDERRAALGRDSDGVFKHTAEREPFEHVAEIVQFVQDVNAAGGNYHLIDFGGGLVMDGEYDLREYLPLYDIPADLSGASVLDVGTASGFFAIEFARRGGRVTAIDVWDGAFQNLAFRAAGVSVQYREMDLFDLSEEFGRFDLVFCGSVLMHVWDQFNALRRLRSVSGGRLILATAVIHDGRWRRVPISRFVGKRGSSESGEYWTTWMPNRETFCRMVSTAGFSKVEYRKEFRLRSVPGHHGFDTLHGVVHAFV